jgi:hypothetical protein
VVEDREELEISFQKDKLKYGNLELDSRETRASQSKETLG